MSALTSPKGPLPARVYWFRRTMVLSVVFLVVFGTARFLSASSDASTDDASGAVTTVSSQSTGAADPAGATSTADASPVASPSASPTQRARKKKTPPPLPSPTGTCANEEVVVTPSVATQRTSTKVPITLTLRTTTTEACTWQVSKRSITVKIDSGPRDRPDEIWHSRQCPAVIPTQDVTLYREHDTTVEMVWNGRRSDDECSDLTDWARVGWYHVSAAAYAGEPTSVQFELKRPSPVTVTRTVDPKPTTKSRKSTTKKTGSPAPSGAVEPNG